MNSSMLTIPSPSVSTALTILLQSSMVHLSPSFLNMAKTSSGLIFPSPFKSNVRNAPCMSTVLTPPPLFWTSMNSLKLIKPSPSKSTTLKIFGTSPIMWSFPIALNMALYSC
ncbi:hypothetical protein ACB092_07G126000 [Castanea dentata]